MEIFDKLFTYVDNASDLTQSMVDNYKNSMIVLGDQKQMFIPSINSYVGLGMDSYNYLLNKTNDSKIPKATITRGTTVTLIPGEIYGVEGNNASGSRVPTKWYANLDNGVTELEDGMIISLRMPTAGLSTVGECLTIDGDESHFHQIVYNDEDFLTTHFDINSTLVLQYDAYKTINVYGIYNSSTHKYVANGNSTTASNGVWRVLNTYDSNTDVRYQQTIYSLSKKVATNGCLVRYTLAMMTPAGRITSLFSTSTDVKDGNTKTNKQMYTGYLDPRKIFFWSSSNYYAANANVTKTNVLLTHKGDAFDYRYTFNCGTTLTANSPLYLVGTIDNSGFKLDTNQPWSCTLPSSEDGKVYIYIGMTYSDANGYRGTLEENNTIYVYKKGAIRTYNGYSDFSYHADNADYSKQTSFSAYSQCSYTSYIIKQTSGLWPVTFSDRFTTNSINRYYSYSYVTANTVATVPPGFTQDDIFNIHDINFIRFKQFNMGLYWYETEKALYATYFRGMLLGVASYADSLYTPRSINGTNFDGSDNIVTTYWGNGRNFHISDNTSTYSGPDSFVRGNADITLKLPKTLVVDIVGKSTYATTSDLSNRTYRQNVRITNTNNTYFLQFTDHLSNTVFSYSYINSALEYNPYKHILTSTYFKGWLTGNADSATKLYNNRKINGTYFDGTKDITTDKWGTARNIVIKDYYSTYTYTNTNINGSSNFDLKLPQNIHANINGNADTSTYANSTYLSNNGQKTLNIHTTTDNSYYITFGNIANNYSYSYVNGSLIYNPNKEELTTTYITATTLIKGHIRAQDQWGRLGDGGEGPMNIYNVGDKITYTLNGVDYDLVCVIPSNFIGNGKARFIIDDGTLSSRWFNLSTETNNNYSAITVETLTNKTTVAAIKNPSTSNQEFTGNDFGTFLTTATSSDISGENIKTRNWAFYPTDNSRFTLTPTNSDAILDYKAKYWYNYGTSTGGYGISPYIQRSASATLQFNNDYLKGTTTSDFDGLENTNKIIDYYNSKTISQWKKRTDVTPEVGTNKTDYEVAALKVRQKYGDKAYLPSAGELGFLIARLTEINAQLTNKVSTSADFWSSTQYSATGAYRLSTGNGLIGNLNKYLRYSVRAFVQL